MPSAEYGALVRLERSAVVEALRKLPGRQREAIVLRQADKYQARCRVPPSPGGGGGRCKRGPGPAPSS
jgi:hypothetical protein